MKYTCKYMCSKDSRTDDSNGNSIWKDRKQELCNQYSFYVT